MKILLFLLLLFPKESTTVYAVIVLDAVGISRDYNTFRILGENKVYNVICDNTKFIVNFN